MSQTVNTVRRVLTDREKSFYGMLTLNLNNMLGWLGNKTETAVMLILWRYGKSTFSQIRAEISERWRAGASDAPTSIINALRNLQATRHVVHLKNGTYGLTGIGYATVDLMISVVRSKIDHGPLAEKLRDTYSAILLYGQGLKIPAHAAQFRGKAKQS